MILTTDIELYDSNFWPEPERLPPPTKPLRIAPYSAYTNANPIKLSHIKTKDLLTRRKKAAISALKFFTHNKPIASSNKPHCGIAPDQEKNFTQLAAMRYRAYDDGGVLGSFDLSADLGVGNCKEKSAICYAALVSSSYLIDDSNVTMIVDAKNESSGGLDHQFVVITDRKIAWGR